MKSTMERINWQNVLYNNIQVTDNRTPKSSTLQCVRLPPSIFMVLITMLAQNHKQGAQLRRQDLHVQLLCQRLCTNWTSPALESFVWPFLSLLILSRGKLLASTDATVSRRKEKCYDIRTAVIEKLR